MEMGIDSVLISSLFLLNLGYYTLELRPHMASVISLRANSILLCF